MSTARWNPQEAGKHTIGVDSVLPDETCWFLAADFDKKTWQADSAALSSAMINRLMLQSTFLPPVFLLGLFRPRTGSGTGQLL